jgi:hypothetical protein
MHSYQSKIYLGANIGGELLYRLRVPELSCHFACTMLRDQAHKLPCIVRQACAWQRFMHRNL